MTDAIAVLDIGMTNKKVVLYSTELSMIAEKRRIFPPLCAKASKYTTSPPWKNGSYRYCGNIHGNSRFRLLR
ncbi:MAG: hypothetical protein SAMD01599839_13780 [Rectinema sp.]